MSTAPQDTAASKTPADPSLPLRQIVSWSAASIGVTAMGLINAIYLMKFSTDVLLIAPGVMGAIYGLGRIWDAISDPLVGRMSDRTRSRFGRRRSWIFASVPAIAIAFVMLWAPPDALSPSALAIWIGAGYLLFSTAQTMFLVPHYALGVEMTSAYHERTRVSGLRHFIGGLGMLTGLVAFFLVARAGEGQREIAQSLAMALAIGTALLIALGIAPIRERAEHQGRGGQALIRAFWDVFRNPHARILLTMYGIEHFGVAITGVLAVYMAEYIVLAPPTFFIVVLICSVGSSIAFAPLWIRLSRSVGKRRLWLWGTAAASVSYLLHAALFEGWLVFWCLIAIATGATSGLARVVGLSIKADVIDWDEVHSGERKEGAYLAVWTFVEKSAAGISIILLGFALQIVGYDPNAEQSEAMKWTLRGLYGVFPAICFLGGTFLLSRFGLDETEHARIRAELDRRRQTADEGTPLA